MQESLYTRLAEAGEYYAAELFTNTDREPIYRYAMAWASYFKNAEMTPYDGGKLYPCGQCIEKSTANSHIIVRPSYSYSYNTNTTALKSLDLLEEKVPGGGKAMREEISKVAPLNTPHLVGGHGYTHSHINFRRILADGLAGYRARVNALPSGDFRDALLVILDGIDCYRLRCIRLLERSNAPKELIDALKYVPENPPRSIYEALVAWNFVYYIDGCDDLGGLDRILPQYHKGEDIRPLLSELYTHADANDGWSHPLGPNYNDITVQCLDAIHNIRRPNIQLLVTKEMPDEVWNAVYGSLATSCGQPALYNYDEYIKQIKLRIPEVTDADLADLAFGGCTETMIEGKSNVGSDDAGINTALIFEPYMRTELGKADSFEAFMEGFISEVKRVIGEVCGILDLYRATRAKFRPQPVRTLFTDDCIDTVTEFNAGGARYYWSVINVAGLINVIDSMQVIKALVFDEHRYTPESFLEKLASRDPAFLSECAAQPKHGNDSPELNAIAEELSRNIFAEFEKHPCTPRGKYFPVSNQFTTYVYAGKGIGPTPDGRNAGDPLNDSCGAVMGRDKKGPTALLNSVASLHPELVIGTPITNIRISKPNLSKVLKPLTYGYFAQKGMQLQITCASKKELLEAVEHPERYGNLIVRMGGYSEYFTRLTPVLQQTVINRTEY